MNDIELTILRNILQDDKYMRKVVPFLKSSYFNGEYRLLFKQFVNYVQKYNKIPTKESLSIDIQDSPIPQEYEDKILSLIEDAYYESPVDKEWLMDVTEKWCQDRALYLAIMESISIIDGKSEKHTKNVIPELLTTALSVSFNTTIGHDYIEDMADRYEFYHEDLERLPFDLQYLNEITKGGIVRKSLTIILAGTGVGKSMAMCHFAAANLTQGKNVLYITLEMSEYKIAERIDANLLNIPLDMMNDVPKDLFTRKINDLKTKSCGKLIIKEYPTSSANANHFRALLNDLKMKKNFIPDVVYIDYINICSSSRLKSLGNQVNSYTYIKAIAEEIRGLAVEFNLPIISATQVTRSGYTNSDPGLEDTSESFGLPATADLMLALVSTEELEKENQLLVKQLKNRYADVNKKKRFLIGINRNHMRLFDIDESKQMNVQNEKIVADAVDIVDFIKNPNKYDADAIEEFKF